jgi:hypothetical protein
LLSSFFRPSVRDLLPRSVPRPLRLLSRVRLRPDRRRLRPPAGVLVLGRTLLHVGAVHRGKVQVAVGRRPREGAGRNDVDHFHGRRKCKIKSHKREKPGPDASTKIICYPSSLAFFRLLLLLSSRPSIIFRLFENLGNTGDGCCRGRYY